jgi:hypothetical protein
MHVLDQHAPACRHQAASAGPDCLVGFIPPAQIHTIIRQQPTPTLCILSQLIDFLPLPLSHRAMAPVPRKRPAPLHSDTESDGDQEQSTSGSSSTASASVSRHPFGSGAGLTSATEQTKTNKR